MDWIPWGDRATDWTNALTSGKGGPDITELGNTDTPGVAGQGALADIASDVNSWSSGSDLIKGNLANDTVGSKVYAVPWFGGVRGIWYNKDQFAKAGISSPPATWAQLVSDAKALMKAYPGTFGLGAPSDDSNAIVSFIWGAGGQVAVQSGSQWKAELNSPQSEAGIKFYADLLRTEKVSPAKYIGETELGTVGATSGGSERGLRPRHAGHVHRRPVGAGVAGSGQHEEQGAVGLVPDPEREWPEPGTGLRGRLGPRRLGQSKNQSAAWDLVQVMDSPSNATTFANSQGFFPEFTSQLSSGVYTSSPVLSGFAKAAGYTQISPLNSKNWATADTGKYNIIPNMMKALMQGANFTTTVNNANTQLQTCSTPAPSDRPAVRTVPAGRLLRPGRPGLTKHVIRTAGRSASTDGR